MRRDIRGMPGSLRDEVEKRWQRGEPPDLFALTETFRPASPRDLADAVLLDLTESWKHGHPRSVGDYFRNLPELASDPKFKVELIQRDYQLQCEHSQSPDVDSYVMQFPDLQQVLRGVLQGEALPEQSLETAIETPEILELRRPRSMSQAVSSRPMPEQLGRYLVQSELGSGQFGAVYRAFDDQLHRVVAVKVPKRSGLSAEQLTAFQTEARNLARLEHPHVVSVYDFGTTDDGGCFVVGQFIDGESLYEAMNRRQFSFAEAAIVLAMVADGLQAAHERDIVHRDVKPANILLDTEGRPYVADFGLAITDEQKRKSPDSIAGSPAYMSPEQTRGDNTALDGRSDLWAVGIILYEMLTGTRPFRGNLTEIQRQIATSAPRRPRDVNGEAPIVLEEICLRCLATSPADRFATAADLAAELRSFLPAQKTARDSFRVIATTQLEEKPFPVLGCTVMNRSSEVVVITEAKVEVLEFRSLRSHGASRELSPVAWIDVCLPVSPGTTTVPLAAPILIAPQDAATIAMRCHCEDDSGGTQSPTSLGAFRFRFSFITDVETETTTDEIKLGRI